MGDITPFPVPVPPANPPPIAPHPPAINLLTFDELLLERAADADQCPLIAYSKTKHGVEDYELLNGAQLNRLVDGAVKALRKERVDPVVRTILSAYSIRIPVELEFKALRETKDQSMVTGNESEMMADERWSSV